MQAAGVENVTPEAVRQWTGGYSRPDMNKLKDIAKVLDCSINYLFGIDDLPKMDNNAIHERIGLSDSAIKVLEECNDFEIVKLINYLFEKEEFMEFITRMNNLLMYSHSLDGYIKDRFGNVLSSESLYDGMKYSVVSCFDKMINGIYKDKAEEYSIYKNSTAQEREERWNLARERKGGIDNG